MNKSFKNLLLFLPRLVFRACYAVGLILLAVVRLPKQSFRQLRKNAAKARLYSRLVRPLWHRARFNFTFIAFLVLIVGTVGVLQSAALIAQGQRLKGQVLGATDAGLGHVRDAATALQNQDTEAASQRLAFALQSFEQSRKDLNSNNLVLQSLINLVPQKYDAEQLLRASALLTQAGLEWTEFYRFSQSVAITPQGIVSKDGNPEILKAMDNSLQNGRIKTTEAVALLESVNPQAIPSNKRPLFIDMQAQLTGIQTAIDTVSEVFNLVYTITSGDKTILLLFENNNELRASGGFPGTYGVMKLRNGQISSLDVRSIYALDGQLRDSFAPPHPLRAVTDRWYLRDSNWFADFPQSARVMTRFYEREGGETPDLIIAMTPQVIIDLLRITGPISLPRYNTTFSAQNFVELTQVESSVNYDKLLNEPKQILADFFPALLQQLGTLTGEKLMPVLSALQNNLATKHILVYSRDPSIQKRLDAFNWTGAVKATDRDYLMVSSSNLGGTKTDTYITQDTTLKSTLSKHGHVRNTLTVTRVNPLSNQDQFRNLSFIRIYVPQGSKLVSAQGFTTVDLPALDTDKQKTDADALAWEQNSVIDTVSGTLIGTEAGKTIFGNWLEVRGGETKTVTVTYEVPLSLNSPDRYSLLIQKQPGTHNQTFQYSLSFENHSLEWSNVQPQKLDRHELNIVQPLNKDLFLGFIFKR